VIYTCTVPSNETLTFNWIGTSGHTGSYINPHICGKVVVSMSSIGASGGGTALHKFVGQSADGYNCTGPFDQSWMAVDIGENYRMMVTGYCLRHDQHGSNAIRCWTLQGRSSVGHSEWDELICHEGDTALSTQVHSSAYWPVSNKQRNSHSQSAYRYFRIVQHGPNSSNKNWLMNGGMELYGKLIVE
jgi:hypothetical protein